MSPTKLLFFILFPLTSILVSAQEIPPVMNYSPVDYGAVNQNWSVSQHQNGLVYAANNEGLLEYDGVRWFLYPSPNGSNMRAVAPVGDRVYGGYYMEFGFWQAGPEGVLQYTSLRDQLPEPMLEGEEIWAIENVRGYLLFRSLQRIYMYDPGSGTFRIFPARNTNGRLFVLDDEVYFQKEDQGIFRITKGMVELVTAAPAVRESLLTGLFKVQDGLGFLTEEGTLYTLPKKADQLEVARGWKLPAGTKVYCSLQLQSGDLAIGTISSGVLVYSAEGELRYTLNKVNGLNNNTVLGLKEDRSGNLWAALDNGLAVANLDSPFREYNDPQGKLGVVYTSIRYRGTLYLGSNQGLFYKDPETREIKLVPGTHGQVWQLKVHGGDLFCGHNNGTYLVREQEAMLISGVPGTWDLVAVPGRPDLLVQGNYEGLSVLRKTAHGWEFRNSLPGFSISSRFIAFAGAAQLLVSHEFKGIYVIGLDENLETATVLREIAPMGIGTSLFRFGEKLLYTSDAGVFRYRPETLQFQLDTAYTEAIRASGESPKGIMVADTANQRIWGFAPDGIKFLEARTIDGRPRVETIAIPGALRRELGVLGFENITAMGGGTYLLGKSNGYLLLDTGQERPAPGALQLRRVSEVSPGGARHPLPLSGGLRLPYDQDHLHFQFALPEYSKYSEVLYRFRLHGMYDTWSPWSPEAAHTFSNISPGDLQLEVEAKADDVVLAEPLRYSFTIARPWYLSATAIAVYVLILGLLFWFVHRSYRQFYARKAARMQELNRRELKRKKLKAKKELMQMKNEKLQQEIEGKNRELAVSTMSLIKKNEFLNQVKEELRKVEGKEGVRSVIRTIDRNINNSDDWKFFEEAFNNADKDFLKKVQDKHPELTANDLKLCAYLRLNLSSKEIAPLLNISVRSVEVKRYRLRKKMDLPRESGLTEYILQI